jgi:DNA-directed RNA polymerase I subunit RPA2
MKRNPHNPCNVDPQVLIGAKLKLQQIVFPHVESFNYFITTGLSEAISDIPPIEFNLGNDLEIKMIYTESQIGYPVKFENMSDTKLTPREARERGISYSAPLIVATKIELNNGHSFDTLFKCGNIPIMVMSERCHLRHLSSKELVDLKEESNEMGGYFVVNGIERVIRLLQVPRMNHAMAIERGSFKKRGPAYTEKGVTMRCVRKDQTSVTLTLHFLNDGSATLRFSIRKQEFLLPIIIVARAMAQISDKEFFDRVCQNDTSNTYLTTRLELLFRDAKNTGSVTQSQCLAYLGSHFRHFLPISDDALDETAGRILVERYLFVHTKDFGSKLECLIHMTRKLYSFAQNTCASDNPDALMNHEILLPGHLITMYVKEKLEDIFLNIKQAALREYRLNTSKCLQEVITLKFYQKQFERFGGSIGNKVASFLSTGNINSSTGLDLMQVSGYTIVAERLNIFRYMSHFQSVHRGQFFTTMKTTLVRKLLPESWGFLCPVHTPDGSPCGLLNHLTRDCIVLCYPTAEKLPAALLHNNLKATSTNIVFHKSSHHSDSSNSSNINSNSNIHIPSEDTLKKTMVSLGVIPCGLGSNDGKMILTSDFISVVLDGVVIGGVHRTLADQLVQNLRSMKHSALTKQVCIDPTTEIAYIPFSKSKNQAYSGIYLFTQPGRMIRPCYNLQSKEIEWIGPMEQVFMNIACTKSDIQSDTTHLELAPTTMLSHIASLTPFSDYNQSPRNMYQCQMGKQTMGTPTHAFKYRADNKLFRIQNSQSPIVQTRAHSDYSMDDYPQGVNAIVAVISFTGIG